MSQPEDEISPLMQAYLKAQQADAEKGKPKRPNNDKKKAVARPNIRHTAIAQFKRENSEVEADLIAEEIEAEGSPVIVRKATIRIEPPGQRVELLELQERALAGPLKTQATRMGRSWSRWINEGRAGGWKNIGPTMSNSWAEFMAKTGERTLDSRIAVVESFVGGMELDLDDEFIYANPTRLDNTRNRVDYIKRITAQIEGASDANVAKMFDRGKGEKLDISVKGVATGGFLTTSFEHLSGYHGKRQQLMDFRDFILNKEEEMGVGSVDKPFTARFGCAIVANWIG